MHSRALLFYCLLPCTLLGQADSFLDRGTFKTVIAGKVLGTEQFEIETAGEGYRMKGEIKLKMPNGSEASESTVINLSHDLLITSYTRLQKAPKKASIVMNFSGGNAKAHYTTPEGEKDYDYILEPSLVILDTNFFHHYALLVRRYDFAKGGAQHVQVLIPQEAEHGLILVTYGGKEDGLDKLIAKTDAVEIHLWCDGGRKLVKLAVPAAQAEIVRDPAKN